MEIAFLAVGIIIGLAVGALFTWLVAKSRTAAMQQRLALAEQSLLKAEEEQRQQNTKSSELQTTIARLQSDLEHERRAAEEKIAILNRATEELRDTFKALSSEALKSNNESFLNLAKTALETFQTEARGDLDQRKQAVENLVKPIHESLSKVDTQIRELEKTRQQAYGSLTQHLESLVQTQEKLKEETGNLVQALRSPSVRGRWGEIQLRKVVEIAGMLSYCDFSEQVSVTTDSGRLRPDLVVKLPGEKNIVVDAKAPLMAYLDAMESKDETERTAKLKDHARQVRDHLKKLGAKSYWDQFDSTPEFVVMFLPGETFFSAALESDPTLIEEGVNLKVIPASPTTLIALLRAVAYGWRQEKLAESAHQISTLGQELYERIRTMTQHYEKVGGSLEKAVEAYNKSVASLESRVLVTARKFPELGTTVKEEIPQLEPIEKTPRILQAPDMEQQIDTHS